MNDIHTPPSFPLKKLAEKEEGQGAIPESELLNRFLSFVEARGLELYPAQEEAILQLFEGHNVILNTPTGSGKSLVATALHFYSLGSSRRSYYTCPIKALVNEKFLALCQEFGPDQVGMVTGDASVNPKAPIICCTAEILANMALKEGSAADVDDIVMDEFHYYSDRERGVAWQIPLLVFKRARFMLMSATLGDVSRFEEGLSRLNGLATTLIKGVERPVPLKFLYQESPLTETVQSLVSRAKAPIYVVSFTQRDCAEKAQAFTSYDLATKEDKKAINEAIQECGLKFNSPYAKDLLRLARQGIGLHHAGLLPKYRYLIERLAQKGLLKVICGTDTLGVGVNVPIRTVLFTQLCKYDGEKTAILSVRDFKQIAGRAGRKGFDDEGLVVAQAPEHVIENLRLEAKAGGDTKKLRKIVRKKPPEKGFVIWNQETFQKLQDSDPEPLVSRFKLSHGMMIHVLTRPYEGCVGMRSLIRESHETPAQKERHFKAGFQIFRSLIERGIFSFEKAEDSKKKAQIKMNQDLGEDFSMNHSLSLFLLDTIKYIDPYSETYALDLLSLCESILENPDGILRKQKDKARQKRFLELKMEGAEFEERQEELEKVDYPKPNAELIYEHFNVFAARHPWLEGENIRPKSIAREMYESFMSFGEYINEYELQRSEGLLLRYLSDIYKLLIQTLPPSAKDGEMEQIIDFLGAMLKQVDTTLLDEWERLKDPQAVLQVAVESQERPLEQYDITRNTREFHVAIRNKLYQILKFLIRARVIELYEDLREFYPQQSLTFEECVKALELYHEDHGGPLISPESRRGTYFKLGAPEGDKISGEQILLDREGANDWALQFEVLLGESRTRGQVVLQLIRLGPIGL